MPTRRRHVYSLSLLLMVGALLVAQVAPSFKNDKVAAADLSKFDPGRIIDDGVFYNPSTMTTKQIQAFLDTHIGWNHAQKTQTYKKCHPEWDSNPDKIVCLKDYKGTTRAIDANANCDGYPRKETLTAAQIIRAVAKSCGVNPRVILALLEKESSLVSHVWPSPWRYRSATGMGCPDTADCDSKYFGFFNQVYWASWQFKEYRRTPGSWNYQAGKDNTIKWHPNSSCGTSKVFIKNQATAGLYIYTPYRPNKAALNAGYGQGNSCSSYGNRNFYHFFTDWFGSTRSNINFETMKTPRWMEIKQDTKKVDPYTGTLVSDTLPEGQQIYFKDSIKVNGVRYLRTKSDSNNLLVKAIKLERLSEVSTEYTPLKSPRWLEVQEDVYKHDPVTGKKVQSLQANTKIFFPTKLQIGETLYLRTQTDTDNEKITGIKYDDVAETAAPQYSSFKMPRWMVADTDTEEYNLKNPSGKAYLTLPASSKKYLDHLTELNGHRYATDGMPSAGTYPGINLDDLRSIESGDFSTMKNHRAYKLIADIRKVDLSTGEDLDTLLPADQIIYFQTKINIGEDIMLRTVHDANHNTTTAIDIDDLEPVEVAFEAMKDPRRLQLKNKTKKLDPVTMKPLDTAIPAGRSITFSEKVEIGGQLYLRTAHDTKSGHYKVIPLAALKET